MASISKSDLLRKTADEFDSLMQQFDHTKEKLVAALTSAQLRDEAIAEHVRAFDEGKRIIAELLPIRDNVEAIKNAIVKPVADVIADSSDTNKKFAWAGLLFGAASIAVSLSLPHIPFVGRSNDSKIVIQRLDQIDSVLQPAVQRRARASWQLVLYDRFEDSDASLYEASQLLSVADVGRSHGYDSIGVEPRSDLVYRAVDVSCVSGCRLSLEALVKLQEAVAISKKQVSAGQFTPVLPIEVQWAAGGSTTWKTLEPLQHAIDIPWIGKRNEWQVLKTPYVAIPSTLGVAKIRLILRPYQWKSSGSGSKAAVSCQTDFDEVKVFSAPL